MTWVPPARDQPTGSPSNACGSATVPVVVLSSFGAGLASSSFTSGLESAAATVVLLSAYPFAVYFSAPYTEALFLLLVVGTFYAFERVNWVAHA